jgi:hypothetical protein
MNIKNSENLKISSITEEEAEKKQRMIINQKNIVDETYFQSDKLIYPISLPVINPPFLRAELPTSSASYQPHSIKYSKYKIMKNMFNSMQVFFY